MAKQPSIEQSVSYGYYKKEKENISKNEILNILNTL